MLLFFLHFSLVFHFIVRVSTRTMTDKSANTFVQSKDDNMSLLTWILGSKIVFLDWSCVQYVDYFLFHIKYQIDDNEYTFPKMFVYFHLLCNKMCSFYLHNRKLLYRSCQYGTNKTFLPFEWNDCPSPPPLPGGGGEGPKYNDNKINLCLSYIFPLPANISYFCSCIIKWHHSSGGGLSSVKLASNLHKYLYSRPLILKLLEKFFSKPKCRTKRNTRNNTGFFATLW